MGCGTEHNTQSTSSLCQVAAGGGEGEGHIHFFLALISWGLSRLGRYVPSWGPAGDLGICPECPFLIASDREPLTEGLNWLVDLLTEAEK